MSLKYVNKLDGNSVVVLGGTSGMGFAVAEACIEHGARVVISSRTQANIDKAVDRLKVSYPDAADRIRGYPCDLSQEDCESAIIKLFEFATAGGSRMVDHVVTTAGEPSAMGVSLQDATSASLAQAHRELIVGATLLAKVVHKYVKPAASSSYTLTSGVLGYRPMKNMSISLSAGGAKEALVRGLAVDLAPIRCNVVSPGAILTPLLERMMNTMGGVEVAGEIFKSGTLVNEVGKPEDCAEAYLCSIKNHFMTGVVLHSEGGYLLKTG